MSRAIPSLEWSQGVRQEGTPEREAFLVAHLGIVRSVALRVSGRLPASVELDDLIHDGVVGLIDAVERFDAQRGVQFRSYAETRIHGAILDGLRQRDWRPRSVRARQRSLEEALGSLSSSRHRPATEDEIARQLGMDLQHYRAMLVELRAGPLLSLDDILEGGSGAAPDESMRPDRHVEQSDLLAALAEEIQSLPERERQVLELYYHEELNMKEIGAVLGVTESRVCQLHSQAAGRLRVALRARLHPGKPELAHR